MQLSRGGARRAQLHAMAILLLTTLASTTRADDTPAEDAAPKPAEKAAPKRAADNSTKRASFEMASYTDSDHVTVFTPSVSGTVENVTEGASLSGSYLVDVVSAASVDIVSTASRKWREVRQAGALQGTYKPSDFGVSVASSVSSEPDYFAYGVAVTMAKDFDEKNLTLVAGYGYGHDTIGRTGTSFDVFSRTLTHGSFNGGVTRVIDRSTVLSLSLDVVIESGDQSKPYRYIPMFSAADAANAQKGASIGWVTDHRLFERPLEQLPLSRRRFALTSRLAHRFDSSTARVEERVYDDTWGLPASTTDARWIVDVSRRVSLWPHARFHVQNAVNFWQRAYVSGPGPGWDLPEFRTGDRELGPLWTATGGGGARVNLGAGADARAWSISLSVDAMYTSFLDDLYVTSRTAVLGSMMLEGTL